MKEHFFYNDPFTALIEPLLGIGEAFLKLEELVLLIIGIFGDTIKSASVIFSPDKLIDDVMSGVIKGINFIINNLLSNISLNRNSNAPKDERLGVFGVSDKTRAICVPPSIIDLIILVLCPPLVLFLKKKWNFIFQIILCALLTYKLYYFPGFIFAAVYVLC